MAGEPSDNLIKALSLLRKAAARNEPGSGGVECTVALRALEAFLLADLKARRARVRQWIGILEQAACGGEAAPRARRNGGRRGAEDGPRRQYVRGVH